MKAKVCLVGESAVGKTSMVRRFVLDEFDDRYVTTLGAKVSKKELEVPRPGGAAPIHIDVTVWDIMGEKAFRELLQDAYFQGARGVLAVADLTRYSTLKELDGWIASVYRVVGEIPVVYAINKHDLADEVMILFGEKEINEHTKGFGGTWMFTSARTGENVEAAFRKLGEKIVQAPSA